MIKIVCDRCGREVYMKNPDLTGRAKIGYEEYDLCKHCILDIKRFINQGKAEAQTCSFSDCDNFKNPDYARCIECKRKQIKSKDEPQTERSE